MLQREPTVVTLQRLAENNGSLEVAQTLLERGADPNERTGKQELTPLHVASENGCFDLVSLLLSAGAQPGKPQRTAKKKKGEDSNELAETIELHVQMAQHTAC